MNEKQKRLPSFRGLMATLNSARLSVAFGNFDDNELGALWDGLMFDDIGWLRPPESFDAAERRLAAALTEELRCRGLSRTAPGVWEPQEAS
jgi:hypothetical protein